MEGSSPEERTSTTALVDWTRVQDDTTTAEDVNEKYNGWTESCLGHWAVGDFNYSLGCQDSERV